MPWSCSGYVCSAAYAREQLELAQENKLLIDPLQTVKRLCRNLFSILGLWI